MKEKQEIVENDPVSQLLGSLKRVEAPGDFDFRVKARIAAGRPVARKKSWLPAAARFAVPLGLLLLIGGFFGYNALYSPNNIAVAPVVEKQPADVAIVDKEIASRPADQVIAKTVEPEPVDSTDKITSSRQNEKRIVLAEPVKKQPSGFSRVEASRPPRVISPRVSAKNILSSIGIEADTSWKVGSVKQNSMAERSGLKPGDVVEAINDQNLTESSTFESKFKGKSLRVKRDGKSMQIELNP